MQTWDPAVVYVQTQQVGYAGQIWQMYAATAIAGTLPTDTTVWGLIVAFDAYVNYEQAGLNAIGIVNAAFSANPKTTTRGHELNWSLSDRGVQVHTPVPYLWLDYRLRCPKIGGNIFAGDKVYQPGDQMYFSSANTPGNFYTAAVTTTAGDSPDTAAAKWTVLAIPRIFHKYLVLGMAGDFAPGGAAALPEKQLFLELAQAALEDQKSLLVGQQGQRIKTVVVTR